MYPIQRQEQRRFPRREVNAPARLYVIDEPEERIRETGLAVVRNISLSGIFISDLVLPTQSLPVTPFKIALVIDEGPLSKIQMTCSIKRLANNGRPGLGLGIECIPEKHQAKLREFLRSDAQILRKEVDYGYV